MRPSTDRLADDDDGVRASDAERDQAIGELRDQFAHGRLSQETFLYRMDTALAAKGRSELADLFTDLPGPPPARPRSLRDRMIALARAATGRRRTSFPGQASFRTARAGVVLPRPAASLPPLRLPPLADRRFTIGRALACDFTLADLSVSRWHARLNHEDEHWLLSDLGSTNGTRLNGWRVSTSVPVRPGDQVTFGSLTFVITDGAGGQP
ncbi:MAG: FHA domain-containing protein [Streptosporangiaceae bacterium]